MGDEQVERFTVWSSRIVGVVGLVAVAMVVLLGVTGAGGDYHPAVYAGCGLIGVVIWVAILRPEVAIAGDRLVLRNPLNTVGIPLAAIEQIAVRRWLAVRVGDRTLTNAGISRSRRQGVRDDQRQDVTGIEIAALSYGAHRGAPDPAAGPGRARPAGDQDVLRRAAGPRRRRTADLGVAGDRGPRRPLGRRRRHDARLGRVRAARSPPPSRSRSSSRPASLPPPLGPRRRCPRPPVRRPRGST